VTTVAASPVFSIVVPTYQRPDRLRTCLDAIARLQYPAEKYEVIVVDDGSETPPAAVIEPYQSRLSIKLITQQRSGPAYARNAGVRVATGQYVAFVDDDCAPHPDWLACLAAQFAATPDYLLGGHTVNRLTNNPYSTASQELIDYLYGWFNSGPKGPVFITSNNMALPVHQFREIGGFDTSFLRAAGEDRDFCDYWKRFGFGTAYVPEAIVYHSHEMNFFSFWQQHFNYGRGAYRFHQARARRGHERVRVEPLRFYLKLLAYPLTQPRSWITRLHISLLMGVSQWANVAGYFWERWIVRP
jgi:glycosyltransferase involved in cell wall biosynthesis